MNFIFGIILILVFVAILYFITRLKKQKKSFNYRVLFALIVGLIFGIIVQIGFGADTTQVINSDTKDALDNGYVLYTDLESVASQSGISLNDDGLIKLFGKNALKYDGVTNSTLSSLSSGDLTADSLKKENFVTNRHTSTGMLVTFMSIFSTIYINLLQLIVIPLIFVSITTAIVHTTVGNKVSKKIVKIIALLMITVTIAALIGVGATLLTGIDGEALSGALASNSDVITRAGSLTDKASSLGSMSYADLITAPVSKNFGFLVGEGSTAAMSTVLFGMFLGYAILQVQKRKPEKVSMIVDFLYQSKEVVLSLVREVLKITPYAIVALMTTMAATTTTESLGQLAMFVLVSYVAIIIMYLVHLLFVSFAGLNPIQFLKKGYPVLLFGFGSRSSMAALGFNIDTQREKLGVDEVTSDLAATFSVTIGQNGCAGVYPAMVAVLAMQATGQDITITWLITLLVVIAISSFGIAGVGGGASFAAVAVLSIMGLPVTLAAILISVEPLIDMARTALNISDGMLVGVLVSKSEGELNTDLYNQSSSEDK
ncbi:MAG: cation:dicarboxylate symporter family transporter [Mycoplasmatales bacterium]